MVPGQGAVVAITHFGYLDFAFAELLLWWHNRAQMRFLITQGAADHWFAGPAVSAAGHVVVGYGSGAHAYDAAVARLRAGEYIAILPEAGVSRSFTVRECKTGAVRMAAEAGVPDHSGLHLGRAPADDPAPWLLAAARLAGPGPHPRRRADPSGFAPGPGGGRPAGHGATAPDPPARDRRRHGGLPPAACAGRLVDAGRTSAAAPPRRRNGAAWTRPTVRGAPVPGADKSCRSNAN